MAKVLSFVSANSYKNVAVLSSEIIGFAYKDGHYDVFLRGGGCVTIRSGMYEYDELTKQAYGSFI